MEDVLNFKKGRWLNKPESFIVFVDGISITTEPHTDLWQQTYYGFSKANAPAYLFDVDEAFTFTTKVDFTYYRRFDQCGILIYLDERNWFKASVEFESEGVSKLGSVVTNDGFSDWATQDIPTPASMWYRLSQRGPDFRLEYSLDGQDFYQLRIFRMKKLDGVADDQDAPTVPVGLYACSPEESSFVCDFSQVTMQPSEWSAHK
ncbi:DUF1349 domain-containing protein [Persicirhabdus sediminis]|uniref:DUF1349 domain-containing protein n=1 Tax=Persicirhabdus sediminis TaxID=454144 RepID=UPI002D80A288|nr:DUF1349 domain-containing protein [Persicirhabdus sediminis]